MVEWLLGCTIIVECEYTKATDNVEPSQCYVRPSFAFLHGFEEITSLHWSKMLFECMTLSP